MIKRILVAVDGSEHSARAVTLTGEIAQKFGAAVTVVHAMPKAGTGRVPDELAQLVTLEHIEVTEANVMRGVAEEIVRRAEGELKKAGVSKVATMVEVGDPATLIADIARSSAADLVVIGRRGLGRVGGSLLGSVSLKVNHLAECPCLTVK